MTIKMKMAKQVSRSALLFAESAQKHFAFLQAQGFNCVDSDPTFARFESSSLFVNIYHGRRSFAIGLELGRLGNDDDEKQPYPMPALLEAVGATTAAENYRYYMTHTPDGVDNGLAELAKLFFDHVSQGLCNTELFRVLKEQGQARIYKYAHEIELRQMRRKLDIAWHAKDYAKIAELLPPFRSVLTPVELHKLEYAKKHVTQPKVSG